MDNSTIMIHSHGAVLLIGMRMVKVQWSFQSHLTASETHSKGGA